MDTKLIKAKDRGHADHGWLKTWHSFSFASYYDPGRMHFGALRVLNDDIIHAGEGFGMHPHNNMEIITIPLSGALTHEDSMGHRQAITENEVQVMSAGSGIRHSEFNHSDSEAAAILQLWIFPREDDITPVYDQKKFRQQERENKFQTLVHPDYEEGGLAIHQDAWISRADISAGKTVTYSLKEKSNGVYVFLIDGQITIAETDLAKRDALEAENTDSLKVYAATQSDVLVIEVPMG